MIRVEIGKTLTLEILRLTDIGAYVGYKEMDPDFAILLPKKQVPEDAKTGSEIRVFTYKDSEDRPIATVNKPYAEVGEFAYLTVKSATKIGAFLDWGLERDLFVPFKEQEEPLKAGDQVLVYVYLDKSNRLAATTRVYDYLSAADKDVFKKNDTVNGVVYRTEKSFGAFVAIAAKDEEIAGGKAYEKMIFGLIPASQVFERYHVGDRITGRVVRVREDGKIDIDSRKRDFEQLDIDGKKILEKIREYGGELPFSDKASPEIIKREMKMSKSEFKKALGHLYKERKVLIKTNSVILSEH